MAERAPNAAVPAAGDDPAGWDDAALVCGVRRAEPRALAELYDRFAPRLVRLARAWRVPVGEREPIVAEVIGDVALALARHAAAPPRSLAAYLTTALRHRIAAVSRAEVREARLLRAAPEAGASGRFAPARDDPRATGAIGLLLCSEHARRASDPAWEPATPDPVVARLAAHLIADLADDDRRLLAWLAHDVPLRTAADWLGVRYDTAVKRAQRLRARLRVRAEAYVAALDDGEERRAVLAVLRRGATPTPPAGRPATPALETER